MKRREFIAGSLALGALTQIKPSWASPPKLSTKLVGGYIPVIPRSERKYLFEYDVGGFISSFDLVTKEVKKIDIGCGSHAYTQSPGDPALFATVSRWATRGAVANMRTGSVVKLQAPAGMRFFGHPRFAADGTLYISAAMDSSKAGRLLTVDPVNGKVLRDMPSGGDSPHEFLFLEPNVALIANNGLDLNKSCLAWLDLKAGKVLRTEPMIRVGHIRKWNNQLLIGAQYASHAPGFAYYDFKTRQLTSATDSKHFDPAVEAGEGLSQASLSPTLVATTTQRACGLLLWDTQAKTSAHLTFKTQTCGLIEHQGLLYMTTLDGRLRTIQVNTKDLALSKVAEVEKTFSNSSHMLLAEY